MHKWQRVLHGWKPVHTRCGSAVGAVSVTACMQAKRYLYNIQNTSKPGVLFYHGQKLPCFLAASVINYIDSSSCRYSHTVRILHRVGGIHAAQAWPQHSCHAGTDSMLEHHKRHTGAEEDRSSDCKGNCSRDRCDTVGAAGVDARGGNAAVVGATGADAAGVDIPQQG